MKISDDRLGYRKLVLFGSKDLEHISELGFRHSSKKRGELLFVNIKRRRYGPRWIS